VVCHRHPAAPLELPDASEPGAADAIHRFAQAWKGRDIARAWDLMYEMAEMQEEIIRRIRPAAALF
jgi:hypothetical protein